MREESDTTKPSNLAPTLEPGDCKQRDRRPTQIERQVQLSDETTHCPVVEPREGASYRRKPGVRICQVRLAAYDSKWRSGGMTAFQDAVPRSFASASRSSRTFSNSSGCQSRRSRPRGRNRCPVMCPRLVEWSNRIVGYSMDSRMKSQLAVDALRMAVARRNPAGTVVHSGRGSQFRSRRFVAELHRHGMVGSMGRVGAGDNAAMESFFSLLQNNILNERRWVTRNRSAPRDRDLDRADLPPMPATARPRQAHPNRIRDHQHQDRYARCVVKPEFNQLDSRPVACHRWLSRLGQEVGYFRATGDCVSC